MQTTTLTYPSHDGTSTIRALVWEPDDAARPDLSPRAVVQLVHGMSEHVERYAPFAEFLVAHGFVVCANDHVGHGKTACSADDLGHMTPANIPVIVARLAALRGERHRSRLIDSMGAGAYGRAIKDARTSVDWIATDPDVVDEYIADPLCGQTFTVGAYGVLASLVADATDARLARRVPRDLPLLFIAGAEDPVGECGRGVSRAVDEYRNAGLRLVEKTIYPGARHEILNEPIRETVWADVEAFLARQGV